MNGKSGSHDVPKDLSQAMASSQDPPPPQPPPNGPVPPTPPEPPPPPPPSPVGCFLTTAVVGAMGLDDASEPLQMARYLRDHKMTDGRDRKSVELYYKIAPTIVQRSTNDEWLAFWQEHMRQITAMIKLGEYELAKKLYTLATAQLIHQKATRFADAELVDAVYDYGLRGFAKDTLPYPIRYGFLKAAFAVGLFYGSIRRHLALRKFRDRLGD